MNLCTVPGTDTRFLTCGKRTKHVRENRHIVCIDTCTNKDMRIVALRFNNGIVVNANTNRERSFIGL